MEVVLQNITNIDYTNIIGGGSIGTYKQTYEMKETKVASDDYNIETVTVNLSPNFIQEDPINNYFGRLM